MAGDAYAVTGAPYLRFRYARYGFASIVVPIARRSVSCGANFRLSAWTLSPSHSRSGANSLQIYFPGTLVQQDWAATPGDKYASSGYVFTASSDKLTGSTVSFSTGDTHASISCTPARRRT